MTEPNPTPIRTIRVRVRDKHAPLLRAMAVEANQVWNFCNDLSGRMLRERGHWMTGFDFSPYTVGASAEFEHIGSSTIQEVSEQYASKRRAAKRVQLRWRKSFGERRSLGWVPFKARAAKYAAGQIRFAGHRFGIWDSYGLAGRTLRAGCFSEDARGRWYFCAAVEMEIAVPTGQGAVGIDLGLKATATCSDGQVLEGGTYRKHEKTLAAAQRARRFERARAINAKIRKVRQDEAHKFSTTLVRQYGEIYVGNVSSAKLVKTKMAKSVHDAGWASLKRMLQYKSQQAGIHYEEVNEAYTTRTCSECGSLSGPQGLTALSVRAWHCVDCGGSHDRDVNAARNICRLGAGHRAP